MFVDTITSNFKLPYSFVWDDGNMGVLNKKYRDFVNKDGFEWQYSLFIDDENGLHKVDYDKWDKFFKDNVMSYSLYSAAISVICYKSHTNDRKMLSEVINFINKGLSEYKIKDFQASIKYSGFLSLEFGYTGYCIQILNI